MEPLKRLSRELVYKGAIIDIYRDKVQSPDGIIQDYDFIGHKGAAAVMPVADDGRILMVRQYRNALDRFTLEIPAGGLNGKDEPGIICAARELEEETGYRSDDLEHLISVNTTIAFCNEKIDIYVARNLKPAKQHLDEGEFVEVEAYTVEQLVDMVYEGNIMDAKTVASIMAYYNKFCR
ncbi:MAG: NUDIX hydrolase [Lachnospiraceae bacterium]|nr:NUDIX hydrolase [Lachnospiraceae bacterium]